MQPEPHLGAERNQRECELELECPLGRLVAEQIHSQQSARPAAQRRERDEVELGHTPPTATRPPFIEAENQERDSAGRYKPGKYEGVGRLHPNLILLVTIDDGNDKAVQREIFCSAAKIKS